MNGFFGKDIMDIVWILQTWQPGSHVAKDRADYLSGTVPVMLPAGYPLPNGFTDTRVSN